MHSSTGQGVGRVEATASSTVSFGRPDQERARAVGLGDRLVFCTASPAKGLLAGY